MIYPSVGQYTEAIKLAEQSPEDYFATKTTLRPVLGADGNPVMSSGNFAVVFKMQDQSNGKIYALKCFTRDQEGRNESYRLIADELQYVESEYLTKIQYLEKELFVDTGTYDTEFPVLLMDWVEGETLDKYIKNHINEQACLNLLVGRFCIFADWLLKQPFAHGDLKPDNIIVKDDGTLVIVDYDGMFVPKMRGQKARELGSPDFRHPQRTEDDFDEHIDDFAVVTILLSIKALSLNNNLLDTLNAKDCVLLHTQDFSNLAQSAANQKLQELIGDKIFARIYAMFVVVLAEKVMDMAMMESVVEKMDRNEIEYNYMVHLWEKCQYINHPERLLDQICFIASNLSNKGHTKAMYFLGICYFWGFGGVEQNYEKAFDLYRKSADNGFSRASLNMGYCYDIGEVEDNPQPYDAQEWYLKSFEQGDSSSLCTLGQLYEFSFNNIDKAVRCYQDAVSLNVASAFYHLGRCYKYGIGVPINYEKALEFFEIAIQKKRSLGEPYYEIGLCYYDGLGVEKDENKAIKYFQDAEFFDSINALYELTKLSYYVYHYPLSLQKIDLLKYEEQKSKIDFYCSEGIYKNDKSDIRKTVDYYIALRILFMFAKNGSPLSQLRIGRCYEYGYGIIQDHDTAIDWYIKAANQGNVKAYLNLWHINLGDGQLYWDPKESLRWLMKAAKCNDSNALYELGLAYLCGDLELEPNYENGVKWLFKSAEQGNENALFKLGECYYKGIGVEQNYEKALDCYNNATKKGHSWTQYRMGSYYYVGDYVEQNYVKAVIWFSKAAESGFKDAQNLLGDCYYNGLGVEQDFNKAIEWYTKAALQRVSWSRYMLGTLYSDEKYEGQDLFKAFEWFKKAAIQGNPYAQYRLGVCYDKGEGVSEDFSSAFDWFKESANNGFKEAQCMLGVLYYEGLDIQTDYTKAVEWFMKAAEQGYSAAQNLLGICYYYGKGVENNYQAAVKWFTMAVEQGDANAQNNLGICYANGDGVAPDYNKAVELFTKAVEQANDNAFRNLDLCTETGGRCYNLGEELYTMSSIKRGIKIKKAILNSKRTDNVINDDELPF